MINIKHPKKLEVDILDYHKLDPKEFVRIVEKYTMGGNRKNIIAIRGDGWIQLIWNHESDPNNICFDDCQIPASIWNDESLRIFIGHILLLEPSKLVIMYFEKGCERYIKKELPKNLKLEKNVLNVKERLDKGDMGFI